MKKILISLALVSFLSVCILANQDHLIPRHDTHPHGGTDTGADEGEPRHFYVYVDRNTGQTFGICAYTWSTPCSY